jgi:hypothetical protein
MKLLLISGVAVLSFLFASVDKLSAPRVRRKGVPDKPRAPWAASVPIHSPRPSVGEDFLPRFTGEERQKKARDRSRAFPVFARKRKPYFPAAVRASISSGTADL